MPTLATLIIAKNEEKNIVDCIKSVKEFSDEIVVLDGGSTDNTREVATELGAKIVFNDDWEGYGKQRQKLQKNTDCDFCLWLDADERVTPKLAEEIKDFVSKAKDNEILSISRANHAFGKRIRFCGYYPDRVLRLHKNSYTTYNDSLVHEKLVEKEDTVIRKSKNDLLHYTYTSDEMLLNKQIRYCTEWSQNYYQRKHKSCSMLKAYVKCVFSFLIRYILQLGILDGSIGFYISRTTARYTFMKYKFLHDLGKKAKQEDK